MSLSIQQEALLKTLSVMTHVDTNIHPVEVEAVQKIMKTETDIDIASSEVYVAAKSEYIEDENVDQYLKSIKDQLSQDDRFMIIRGLKNIISVDGKAHEYELTLFNKVCDVLDITPADIIQL